MIKNSFAVLGIILLVIYWLSLHLQFPSNEIIQLNAKVVFFSLVGGILPALLWLWFWLKEDIKKPEPTRLLLLAFLSGMIAVPFTMPFEQAIYSLAQRIDPASQLVSSEHIQTGVIILWALIEEVMKFVVVYFFAFKSRFFDEPIDALIYLITCALGFSALENSLYLMTSIINDGALVGAMNTNLRFLGATLLHVISSGAVGTAVALSFYQKKNRILYLILGIIVATILHSVFNLFIIKTQDMFQTIIVFSYYWVIALILILLFEAVKLLRPLIRGTIRLK